MISGERDIAFKGGKYPTYLCVRFYMPTLSLRLKSLGNVQAFFVLPSYYNLLAHK